jgi:hypothetical protein
MLDDAMQLALQQPESFVLVSLGSQHYVVAVQNKPGELKAIRNASAETWERLTPLVQIVGPKKPTEPFRAERVSGWVKRIAAAVGHRPCFLDILRLAPTYPTVTATATSPVLSAIYAGARKRGLVFVPVLPLGGNQVADYLKLVRDAALCDGRGAALRYPLLRLALQAGKTHADVLNDALDELGISVSAADVLVDLGYLSGDEELDPKDVSEALNDVRAVGEWRSLVLLGTSMPSMLGGGAIAEGEVGQLPRREWELWSALKGKDAGRLPTYGDYAVQHPHPSQDEIGGNTMRANIRYTVKELTLIARGQGPVIQAGKEQYRDLCRMLVEREEFAGRDFSWGDEVIEDCAAGLREPGAQGLWRGAGTSHHLRVVSDQVRQ